MGIAASSDESSTNKAIKEEGSWLPFIAIVVILVIRWLAVASGNIPIRVRKWFHSTVGADSTYSIN
jgi:hypothetical protein